jgi:PAS domain S-box-containing protein
MAPSPLPTMPSAASLKQSASRLIGRRLFDLGSDQDRAIMRQRVEALGELQPENPSLTTTYQATSAAGIAVQQHWLYLALFNAQGQIAEFLAVGHNVTPLRQVEIEIQDRQPLLDLFFSQGLDGFFFMMLDEPVVWDDSVDKSTVLDYVFAHQRVTKVNQAMLDQYRATEAELLGLTPADLFCHDLAEGRRVWHQLFDAGRLHIDTEERRLDGSTMMVEGDYICLYDGQGRITGHFGIQRDVTDRKQAALALRESEQRFRAVLETMPLIGVMLDLQGRILLGSDFLLELTGWQRHEVLGQDWLQTFIPADIRDEVTTIFNTAIESGSFPWRWENEILTRRGGTPPDCLEQPGGAQSRWQYSRHHQHWSRHYRSTVGASATVGQRKAPAHGPGSRPDGHLGVAYPDRGNNLVG